MSILAKRLDAHFVACAAAAGAAVVASTQKSEAAIVWSGLVNLPIPGDVDGIYVNLATGLTGLTGGATPGWDINPYFGGNTMYTAAPGYGCVPDASATGVAALLAGVLVDGTSATSFVSSGADFPTADPGAYYGFRFQDETAGGAVRYGWARLYRGSATTSPGLLYEWAYDNTGAGILTGAVPAPGSITLLALGAVGLTGRRRK